jgi:hypothetical protein
MNAGVKIAASIDGFYIEKFLQANSDDIKGAVLEIGDDYYTKKYGAESVTNRDVLNPTKETNTKTTIVADLSSAPHIPSDSFNCIILVQTLQYFYSLHSAINTLHAKPRTSFWQSGFCQ